MQGTRRNTSLKMLLAATALAATGLAQAQLDTLGTSLPHFGYMTMAFSEDLFGATQLMGALTTATAPAVGDVSGLGIAIAAPLVDIFGNLTPPNIYFERLTSAGGFALVVPTANFASSGGSLSVTNLQVDFTTPGIYATVSGGNGLAAQTVRVWDYANREDSTRIEIGGHSVAMGYKLTGLTITSEAFELFQQGLGLRPGGIAAMQSIADYGVMTISIPEPSTYALMGLGLLGVAGAARRNRLAV